MTKNLELEINKRFQAILKNCKSPDAKKIIEALMTKTNIRLKEKTKP